MVATSTKHVLWSSPCFATFCVAALAWRAILFPAYYDLNIIIYEYFQRVNVNRIFANFCINEKLWRTFRRHTNNGYNAINDRAKRVRKRNAWGCGILNVPLSKWSRTLCISKSTLQATTHVALHYFVHFFQSHKFIKSFFSSALNSCGAPVPVYISTKYIIYLFVTLGAQKLHIKWHKWPNNIHKHTDTVLNNEKSTSPPFVNTFAFAPFVDVVCVWALVPVLASNSGGGGVAEMSHINLWFAIPHSFFSITACSCLWASENGINELLLSF